MKFLAFIGGLIVWALLAFVSWLIGGALLSLIAGLMHELVESFNVPALGYWESVWIVAAIQILAWTVKGTEAAQGASRG